MKNKPIRKTMILACICILVIWNINLLENYHYVDGEYRDGKYLDTKIKDWRHIDYDGIMEEVCKRTDSSIDKIYMSPIGYDNPWTSPRVQYESLNELRSDTFDIGGYRKLFPAEFLNNYGEIFAKLDILIKRDEKSYDRYWLFFEEGKLFFQGMEKGLRFKDNSKTGLKPLKDLISYLKDVDFEKIDAMVGGFSSRDYIHVKFYKYLHPKFKTIDKSRFFKIEEEELVELQEDADIGEWSSYLKIKLRKKNEKECFFILHENNRDGEGEYEW